MMTSDFPLFGASLGQSLKNRERSEKILNPVKTMYYTNKNKYFSYFWVFLLGFWGFFYNPHSVMQ